jgi:pyruvate,water dikinase
MRFRNRVLNPGIGADLPLGGATGICQHGAEGVRIGRLHQVPERRKSRSRGAEFAAEHDDLLPTWVRVPRGQDVRAQAEEVTLMDRLGRQELLKGQVGEGKDAGAAFCTEGDTGFIYAGLIPYEHKTIALSHMPEIPLKVMMNVANPDRAFAFAATPNKGIGLARLEFIINNTIGIHPKALLEYDALPADLKGQIAPRIAAYPSPREFYVARLTEGIATLAAAFAPNPVIVRMSDFKSNEYANLIGGPRYEPHEENPMIGFRGAGRYIAESFRPCFEMECEALKRVRNDMGLTNVEVMIPFVRTVGQAKAVVEALAQQGLARGQNGLRVIMMCEIPSNAVNAAAFLEHFDGFSIGSNDMTQLTLGIDRDSALIAADFDERDPAVKHMLSLAIAACRKQGKYVGICGQGPSDHPDLAEWLLEQGIGSISLNPDTVIETWLSLAERAKTL